MRLTRLVAVVLVTLLPTGSALARPPSHIVSIDDGPKVTGSLVASVAGRLQFFATPQHASPEHRTELRLPALDLWLGGLATTRSRFVIGGLVQGSVSDGLDDLSLHLALGGVEEPRPELRVRVLGEIGPTFFISPPRPRSSGAPTRDGHRGFGLSGLKLALSVHVLHVFPARRHAIGLRLYLSQWPMNSFGGGMWMLGMGFVWEPGLHPELRRRPWRPDRLLEFPQAASADRAGGPGAPEAPSQRPGRP